MSKIAGICLFIFSCVAGYGQEHDTLHVYFPLDKTNLTDVGVKFMDSLVSHKVLKTGNRIILLGYGDYLGNNDYNQNLSYARAKNVQDYLLMSGFDKSDITLVIGKGKIYHAHVKGKSGNAGDRKVDIIINRTIDTPAAQKFVYYLLRLQVNETIPLHNIQFFRGSIRITPESLPELNMLIDFMQLNATYKIKLEGHVCCLPYGMHDEPYDESTLSTKRAECIMDSLIVHGINKDRLQAIGLGTENPIAYPEFTEEDQLLNRRVEVRIMSK